MNRPHQKGWLTAPELAQYVGVSENTARRWIKQHDLGRKVGGRWRADASRAAKLVGDGSGASASDPDCGVSIPFNG